MESEVIGVVVKWISNKGYGFARDEHGETGDRIIHHSAFDRQGQPGVLNLTVGERVFYVPKCGPKGLYATRVRPVSGVWS